MNRKDFLRNICISGACMCGFSSIAFSREIDDVDANTAQDEAQNVILLQEWILSVLQNMNAQLDKESAREAIKRTSEVHYKSLKMESLLAEYRGDLDKFILFLCGKWGWKVDYDKENKIIIADENKNHCVCPIAIYNKDKDSSAICYCSEGFAEKMFSEVSGMQAHAEVIASLRKGDTSCKYKIVFT